jgi:adenylate cyclase
MTEPAGFVSVGLFAEGMAASFLAADPKSPTSRTLSLLWALLGLAAWMNVPAANGDLRVWQRVYSVIDPACLIVAAEWILRIGRTEVGPGPQARLGERLIRIAQGCAVLYGAVGIFLPEARAHVWNRADPSRPEFYLFAAAFGGAGLLPGVRLFQLLHCEVDRAEKARLIAALFALPFWGASTFAVDRWRPIVSAVGEVIFLLGAIRYHVVQGQRGQFLSRFVAPEVARMVRERGLASAMQQNRVELSVVACDLRGFTAFAETGAPEEVMKLLEDYYAVAIEAVSERGGSIKDFAGDGILALVGAPLPLGDHARRAVEIALAIRERSEIVLARWRRLGLELGLGVGVASGFATVGAIGGTSRLEYGAVGPVVNLASRLASRAAPGQVLAESRVFGLVGDGDVVFEKLENAELKGFARPVALYSVARVSRATAPVARGVA